MERTNMQSRGRTKQGLKTSCSNIPVYLHACTHTHAHTHTHTHRTLLSAWKGANRLRTPAAPKPLGSTQKLALRSRWAEVL